MNAEWVDVLALKQQICISVRIGLDWLEEDLLQLKKRHLFGLGLFRMDSHAIEGGGSVNRGCFRNRGHLCSGKRELDCRDTITCRLIDAYLDRTCQRTPTSLLTTTHEGGNALGVREDAVVDVKANAARISQGDLETCC